MWTRIGLALIWAFGTWSFYSPPVHAGCVVDTTTPTYADGTPLRDDFCDSTGAKKTTGSGGGGGSSAVTATATAIAPTYTEGQSDAPLSLNIQGSLRTVLETLLAGENLDANLLMTGGGAVRQTVFASGSWRTSNATSVGTNIIPTGPKTFYGQVVCSSGACAQTQAIYGDINSDAANGVLLCTITLTATTRDQDSCSVATAPWSYYYIVTTATSGTAATGDVYVMF